MAKGAIMREIATVIEVLVEEGGPVRDQSPNQDHDRDHDRAHVLVQDPAVIALTRAHHGAAHPVAGALASRISIARNASLFPKIEASRNLGRAPDREADKCGNGFN